MKITVTHSTRYLYDSPVLLEPHIFRLRPRANSAQRLLEFELAITPLPAGTTECLDQDGTIAVNAWFSAPTTEMKVDSRFTVEMLRSNPFDYILPDHVLHLPLWYSNLVSIALAPYRMDAHVSESVKQFAREAAANSNSNALSFLTGLSWQIFHNFRRLFRPHVPPWSSWETLDRREGSCRDLAVLFCDACRVMGLAARFVSGYEWASARVQEAYMHAWAEVYLPGIGWRGYDPARGIAVSNGHVAVAAGFDHDLASPVAGWFSGGAGSRMDTEIVLQVENGG
jgi:transglutaminase-like putative cysteine protease